MTTKSDFKNHMNKCKKVINKYGTTRRFECAGFIMPDGKMTNACIKGKNNTRYEHFLVGTIFTKKKEFSYGLHKEMDRFMKDCHAIRFRKTNLTKGGETQVFAQSFDKPTEKQTLKITKAVMQGVDRFRGIKESEHIHEECEYDVNNPTGLDVRRFISKCWR